MLVFKSIIIRRRMPEEQVLCSACMRASAWLTQRLQQLKQYRDRTRIKDDDDGARTEQQLRSWSLCVPIGRRRSSNWEITYLGDAREWVLLILRLQLYCYVLENILIRQNMCLKEICMYWIRNSLSNCPPHFHSAPSPRRRRQHRCASLRIHSK